MENNSVKPLFVAIAYCLLPIAFWQGTSVGQDIYPALQDETNLLSNLHGYIRTRHRFRSLAGNGTDNDFYQYLNLRLGDERKDKLTANLYGTLRENLEKERGVFASIDDTYQKTLTGRLYELYADIRDVGIIDTTRIGRQYLYDVEPLHFDGAKLDFKELSAQGGLRFIAYGGVPVHLFESQPDGDFIAGAASEVKPLDGTRVRLDYIHVNDDNKTIGNHEDNLYVLSAWQYVAQWWDVFGRYSLINGEGRDAQVRSIWSFPDIDLDVRFSYFRQLKTLNDFSIEFDEYFFLLGSYFAFSQYTFDVYKGIGKYLGVDLGVSIRDMDNNGREGAFNHEFNRYYATLLTYDYPFKGTSFSITGEEDHTSNDTVRTFGVDAKQALNKRLSFGIGTYYALYKFDFLTDTEHDNVRTVYSNMKWKLSKRWEAAVDYEVEFFDAKTYHSVDTSLKFIF
ncbi:MAG TPA: hypothetical protein ACFYD6_00435 [Candidatus Brocadiia bacterium]|nr:hypothetical protein [Candidatus Brocadiales bacterium]